MLIHCNLPNISYYLEQSCKLGVTFCHMMKVHETMSTNSTVDDNEFC